MSEAQVSPGTVRHIYELAKTNKLTDPSFSITDTVYGPTLFVGFTARFNNRDSLHTIFKLEPNWTKNYDIIHGARYLNFNFQYKWGVISASSLNEQLVQNLITDFVRNINSLKNIVENADKNLRII